MSDLALYHPDKPEPEIQGWSDLPSEADEDKVVEGEVIRVSFLSFPARKIGAFVPRAKLTSRVNLQKEV